MSTKIQDGEHEEENDNDEDGSGGGDGVGFVNLIEFQLKWLH